MLYTINNLFIILLEVLCCVIFFESFEERKEKNLKGKRKEVTATKSSKGHRPCSLPPV